jgi:hypothetical protein
MVKMLIMIEMSAEEERATFSSMDFSAFIDPEMTSEIRRTVNIFPTSIDTGMTSVHIIAYKSIPINKIIRRYLNSHLQK